jgi:ATP adenylyltransferase
MKILWAPWRMEYVTGGNEQEECIFCPGNDRSRDQERLILYVGDRTMVIMNRFPYINGHLLVAPVRHVSALDALTDEEKLELITMVEKSVGILTMVMNPGGFNIGLNLGSIAGAGVEDHIHFHVVPRWSGDTNYMTVVGDVRVIPEHIQNTYKKLLPFFQEL